MDLQALYENAKSKGFIPETGGKSLNDGRYGVTITSISEKTTQGGTDFISIDLEVVAPDENIGTTTNLAYFIYSGDEGDDGMTYGQRTLYQNAVSFAEHGYFKLPKSVLFDWDKFLSTLTGKTNQTISDKVFYIERKKGKPNKNGDVYSNNHFLSFDLAGAGELGEVKEVKATESDFGQSDNPFARDETDKADNSSSDDTDDDSWMN